MLVDLQSFGLNELAAQARLTQWLGNNPASPMNAAPTLERHFARDAALYFRER